MENNENQYRFKFYINAKHFVKFSDISPTHPHTWEVAIYISKNNVEVTQFSEIERVIQQYIQKYDGQLLNEISPFDTINPTMENIGYVIYFDLINLLAETSWTIDHLEISENPTRTYIVYNLDDLDEKTYKQIVSSNSMKNDIYALDKRNGSSINDYKRSNNIKRLRSKRKAKKKKKIKFIIAILFIFIIIISGLIAYAYFNNMLDQYIMF